MLKVLNEYIEANHLVSYQLRETSNLAITEACCIHTQLTSERPANIVDLFDFEDPRLSISPIWDWSLALCRLKKENIVSNTYTFAFVGVHFLAGGHKSKGRLFRRRFFSQPQIQTRRQTRFHAYYRRV